MTVGRKPKSIRPVRKELSLPADIVAETEVYLFGPDSPFSPHGAWSDYVTELLNREVQKRKNSEAR